MLVTAKAIAQRQFLNTSITDAIDYVPKAYKKLTNKVKNKKARAMLSADYIVKKVLAKLVNHSVGF